MDLGDVLYRATEYGGAVSYAEWTVYELTPKGARIHDAWGMNRRWVTPATKFAWPTKAAALVSLKARSQWYYKHCVWSLEKAEERLRVLGVAKPKTKSLLAANRLEAQRVSAGPPPDEP